MFQWCVSQVLQQQEEREVSKSFAVVPLFVCICAFVYTCVCVMVSLVGLRGQHTNIAASSDSGRIICNRRTVFVSVSLSLGGQTDNFYHNAPLYSLSVGKRIICSVSITTLHQTATLAAFPMSKPLNSVHTDIRCVSKKLSQNILNMKILRWPIF